MSQDITTTERVPDSGNSIDIDVGFVSDEWGVFWKPTNSGQYPAGDLPMDSIEDWLLDRITDLPETLEEARTDPRMQLDERSNQHEMDSIFLSDNPVARATYHEDDDEWVVKILSEEIGAE